MKEKPKPRKFSSTFLAMIKSNIHLLIGVFGFGMVFSVMALFIFQENSRKFLVDSSLSPSCDFFSGKWVYDNENYPLYRGHQCSFLFEGVDCEKYGRKNLNYQHWRWQPNDCDLPRYVFLPLLFLRLFFNYRQN